MVASCADPDRVFTPVETERPRVSPSLKVPCPRPQSVPDRILTKGEVVSKWNRDRSSLRACAATHAALVGEIDVIEGRSR